MSTLRQIVVGTSRGAEAFSIFYQLLYDVWKAGGVPGHLARIKIDEYGWKHFRFRAGRKVKAGDGAAGGVIRAKDLIASRCRDVIKYLNDLAIAQVSLPCCCFVSPACGLTCPSNSARPSMILVPSTSKTGEVKPVPWSWTNKPATTSGRALLGYGHLQLEKSGGSEC